MQSLREAGTSSRNGYYDALGLRDAQSAQLIVTVTAPDAGIAAVLLKLQFLETPMPRAVHSKVFRCLQIRFGSRLAVDVHKQARNTCSGIKYNMTREEYGQAYLDGHAHTVRFLLSRGVQRDTAVDVAQSAWLRGWERLDQLRDERVLVTWVNTIALNLFRKVIRRDQRHEALQDTAQPGGGLNWAAMDVDTILSRCRSRDRDLLLAQLEGVTAKELSERTGASATAMRIRLFRARTAAREIAQGVRCSTLANAEAA